MIRALVLCDDKWHPAETVRRGLEPLRAAGFEFDWIENAQDWSPERMDRCSLVLLSKANQVSADDHNPWMSQAVQAHFVEYVRKGNGLLVVHSGTAGYLNLPVLRGLFGGAFIQHPPQCQVTITPVAGHPLTAGSAPFTIQDEHYFMALDDDQADIFLTTTSKHGEQPGGWTRSEGAGRVCVLTPGHNLEVWLQPEYQTLLRNGLRWCAQVGAFAQGAK
jgi:uncharacterized protein